MAPTPVPGWAHARVLSVLLFAVAAGCGPSEPAAAPQTATSPSPARVVVPPVAEQPTAVIEVGPTAEERCAKEEIGHCRAYGEALARRARSAGTSPVDATALLERAYAALERECRLRQLSDEALGHRDPLHAPSPPDDLAAAARERQRREFGMVAGDQQGSSPVPEATPELTAYLEQHRSDHAGCPRRYAYVAELRAAAPAPLPPRGKLRAGAASVSGGLPADALKAAIAAIEPALLGCYAAGLRRNPSLQGRVGLSMIFADEVGEPFIVDNGGSDLPDAEVIRCAVLLGYGIRLPAGSKGTAVVPMIFTPR